MSRLFRVARHHVIALTVFVISIASSLAQEKSDWGFQATDDRVEVTLQGKPIASFVFRDETIRRPYLCHVKTLSGIQVTRNHPPIAGQDAVDHDTMHPGIWLGFGDISGVDFWRNKGTIQLIRWTQPPQVANDRLSFESESRLLNAEGHPICSVITRLTFIAHQSDWMVSWKATFMADDRPVVFGDQEEMGFGARVATAITEKNGGAIASSTGKRTAKNTWGQAADWCDYSGMINGTPAGITLMSSPNNFRPCWWHNRDYGLFVANPFGRKAMGQGDVSSVEVEPGRQFNLEFAAVIHEGPTYSPEDWFKRFSAR